MLSVGIWFENLLNRALLRELMHEDHRSAHVHYALTEMGDECRHMTMFGKVIDRVGARPYQMRMRERVAMDSLPFALRGSLLWVAALVGEEIFDAIQRRMMDDDELQPLVAQLMRIHVTEEARHIKFAREGVVRRMETAGRRRAPAHRQPRRAWRTGVPVRLLQPRGLPSGRARSEASQPRGGEQPAPAGGQIMGFASLAEFLTENGLLGPVGRRMWRRAGFLA